MPNTPSPQSAQRQRTLLIASVLTVVLLLVALGMLVWSLSTAGNSTAQTPTAPDVNSIATAQPSETDAPVNPTSSASITEAPENTSAAPEGRSGEHAPQSTPHPEEPSATPQQLPHSAAHTSPKVEVIVMGMIHSGHRESQAYSLARVREIITRINPAAILCEIPPDRFDQAADEFRTTGTIAESRVSRFPEYTDVVFPLQSSMHFEIVPCAGWTAEMATDRRAKLEDWKTTRGGEYAEMRAAQVRAESTLKRQGLDGDPAGIHTPAYDDAVREGMEPYNRLFNDDLGLGGWDNINAAHYAHIERRINQEVARAAEAEEEDATRTTTHRLLITFGAWHKYWFLDRLRERDDIRLRSITEFLSDADSTE